MTSPSKQMNILAIGAHPDDIEVGCGATLAKYAINGHNIFLFIASFGSEGGNPEVRKSEQEKSRDILGASALFWGNYKDTQIEVNKDSITRIENILKEINPDAIFVCYPEDTHQDHRNIASITISATRYIKNVLFYETPTTLNFQPNVFVDIGEDYLKIKIDSLLAHASQVDRTNIANISIVDVARSSALFRGVQARVPFAEAFHSSRLFINI